MSSRAVVLGGGIGGLSAAIRLLGAGVRVTLVESAAELGGKAGVQSASGITFDTGPSVLTMPEVFRKLFLAVGRSFEERVYLQKPTPAFRYLFPSGAELLVEHELAKTMEQVRHTFGSDASHEFETYLRHTQGIWEAAAPHFVFAPAKTPSSWLFGGLGSLGAVLKIDPFRSLRAAIFATVRTPELRMLLMRYATYNGSDARTAPATLGCIAHVELSLGGYGVKGGVSALVRALSDLVVELGGEVRTSTCARQIIVKHGRVKGVLVGAPGGSDTFELPAELVVYNGEPGRVPLASGGGVQARKEHPRSMSASNLVFAVPSSRESALRAAHTVVFPEDYEQEFSAIFDHQEFPQAPTLYLCAQAKAHGREAVGQLEPLFVMANAPALRSEQEQESGVQKEREAAYLETIRIRMRGLGLLSEADACLMERSPSDLAKRFPGSLGALYGAASNDALAAFRRQPNRDQKVKGLYYASGSAHPGGGMPMVALSGIHAADCGMSDLGIAAPRIDLERGSGGPKDAG